MGDIMNRIPSAKYVSKDLLIFVILSFLFYFSPAYAVGNEPNAGNIINNLADQMPNLMRLVTAISYVLGMFMVFKGLMEFKKFGEQRTMMSSSHELKRPLIFLVVGTALLYFPTTVNVGISTFWQYPSPLAYDTENGGEYTQIWKNALLIIQLIGAIAFIRGLLIMTQLAGHGGGQNVFGKAMAYIVGGIMCINMYGLLQIIWNTLGVFQ